MRSPEASAPRRKVFARRREAAFGRGRLEEIQVDRSSLPDDPPETARERNRQRCILDLPEEVIPRMNLLPTNRGNPLAMAGELGLPGLEPFCGSASQALDRGIDRNVRACQCEKEDHRPERPSGQPWTRQAVSDHPLPSLPSRTDCLPHSKVLSPGSSRSFGDAPKSAQDDESRIPERRASVKGIPRPTESQCYFWAGDPKTRGLR